jgi:hypothetical protein
VVVRPANGHAFAWTGQTLTALSTDNPMVFLDRGGAFFCLTGNFFGGVPSRFRAQGVWCIKWGP